MTERGSTWAVEHLHGTAAELHGRDVEIGTGRSLWVHHVSRPALVLGSTQSTELVDGDAAARAGVEVARRRSGGGAVWVETGHVVWADLVIPPTDPLWLDDVGRAAHWVGDLWAEAVVRTTGMKAVVHRGPLVTTPWSTLVCFAGLGPGEVTVAGRKVVGVSQRRTRAGARFQVAALLRWEPMPLLDLLRLDAAERRSAHDDLLTRAIPVGIDAEGLLDTVVGLLP